MPILTLLLFIAFMLFQGCNLNDTQRPTTNDIGIPNPQPLEKVGADDLDAGQNRPASGVFRDHETGNVYQLNTGWHVMQRQSKSASSALAKASALIQTWTDQSGQVEERIYECITPNQAQHQSLACQVEAGFVAIGGGAYVDYGSGAGALLWESRIAEAGTGSSAFVTWLASSKDQSVACSHTLHVYVTGIRLKNNSGNYIDPSVLRSLLHLHIYTTSQATHWPRIDTSIYPSFSISAGARTNWGGAGCLLTASGGDYVPNSPYSHLYAAGKDHITSDPSTVSLYSIDYDNNLISNFGYLHFLSVKCDGASVGTGVAVAYCDVDPGYVLSGMGGESRWTSGAGRMLFGIMPTGTYSGQAAIYSKDHRSVSGGYNHVSITEVRKW